MGTINTKTHDYITAVEDMITNKWLPKDTRITEAAPDHCTAYSQSKKRWYYWNSCGRGYQASTDAPARMVAVRGEDGTTEVRSGWAFKEEPLLCFSILAGL